MANIKIRANFALAKITIDQQYTKATCQDALDITARQASTT